MGDFVAAVISVALIGFLFSCIVDVGERDALARMETAKSINESNPSFSRYYKIIMMDEYVSSEELKNYQNLILLKEGK